MSKLFRDIDTLKFDPANSRKHDERNIKAIMDSLKQHGQRKPIVIYSDMVVAGNGTLEAAKRLGWTEIWINNDPFPSLEAAKAYALQDNRSAELAAWDDVQLGDTLSELKEAGYDLEGLGWNDGDLKSIMSDKSGTEGLTDPDEVPEVAQNEFGVKRGDIWQLGSHRLMCGDSTLKQDVEKLINGNNVELCFTSPPYTDQREYNGGKELNTIHLAKFISCSKNNVNYFAVNLGYARKNNEVITYWDDYILEAKKNDLKLLSWNIWDRSGFCYTVGQATAMFTIDHEWIFVFGKDVKKLNKTVENKQSGIEKKGTIRQKNGNTTPVFTSTKSHRQIGTIYRGDVARYIGDDHKHPAMFPVHLPENYILAMTENNQTVYEPFCGSGTTIIACEKTDRKCYGMELDEHYCSVIIKRWQDFTGKKAERIVEGA